MATSNDGHYTRFDTSLLDDGDFCDAGMLNRCLGNLDHLADQFAQPRVKWVLPDSATAFTVDGALTVKADSYFTDEGPLCELWRSAPIDLHLRENLETYRCRVRLRYASAHATHKATLRAALVPWGRPGGGEIAAADVNVATTVGYAGTAHQWEDASTLIYLTPRMVRRRAAWPVSVVDSVGGEHVSGSWIRVQLVVAGSVANDAAAAELSGVELSEYLPP